MTVRIVLLLFVLVLDLLGGTIMRRLRHALPAGLVGIGLLVSTATTASPAPFVQTNLVSDIPGLATITDASLVNPWGISRTTTSPFWISDQGTNLTNLWSVIGLRLSPR